MLLLGTLAVLLVSARRNPITLPLYDYVEYWAAGRLNLTGGNPYSADELLALQQQVGWTETRALMMWNPPWTLSLTMPFGALDFAWSHELWLLMLLVVMCLSAHLLWRNYGGSDRTLWVPLVITATFMPVIVTLVMSQITPVVLLGLVGFLHFQERRKDFLAGAAAALVAVKPHLAHLFWIGVLLWSLQERRWMVLLGGTLAGLGFSAMPVLFNPHVFAQYMDAMLHHPPQHWVMPTLGTLLRQTFGWQHFWLQFVPPLAGVLWFSWYCYTNRGAWSWKERLPLVLLVSFLTSPYGSWTVDMPVLLVPIFAVAASCLRAGPRAWRTAAVLYAVIDGMALWQKLSPGEEVQFLWITPVLILAYLLLNAKSRRAMGCLEAPRAGVIPSI